MHPQIILSTFIKYTNQSYFTPTIQIVLSVKFISPDLRLLPYNRIIVTALRCYYSVACGYSCKKCACTFMPQLERHSTSPHHKPVGRRTKIYILVCASYKKIYKVSLRTNTRCIQIDKWNDIILRLSANSTEIYK